MRLASPRQSFVNFLRLGIATCSLAGCGGDAGPQLGEVHGIVFVDGAPITNAQVGFYPAEGGRPSFGETDPQGQYRLSYTNAVPGAIVGPHSVQIRSAAVKGEGPEPKLSAELPAEYNDESTLTFEVKPGENTANFTLQAKGKPAHKPRTAATARPRLDP